MALDGAERSPAKALLFPEYKEGSREAGSAAMGLACRAELSEPPFLGGRGRTPPVTYSSVRTVQLFSTRSLSYHFHMRAA